MTQQHLDFGTSAPNDGEFLPVAFLKIQENFDELYGMLSGGGSFQPLDSDLTAIAALTTTAYGRSLLELADETALEALLDTLPNLTSIQGVSVTFGAYSATLLNNANEAAFKAAVNLEIGVDVQAFDSDLSSWASVTRASGFDTFAATPSSANLAALVSDETGSGALVFATSPTFVTPVLGAATATSLTSPTVIGGTGTGSTLTLQSTTSVGANDAILALVGNNGATQAYRINTSGQVLMGPGSTFSTGTKLDVSNNADTLQTAQQSSVSAIARFAGATGVTAFTMVDGYGGAAGTTFRRTNTSPTSPSGILSGDVIGQFGWTGRYDAGYVTGNKAVIRGVAEENWTSTANGTYIAFETAGIGSATLAERLRVAADGHVIATSFTTTPPTLATNGQWVLTPTSNTNMRISYRGSDGTTRVANITLA